MVLLATGCSAQPTTVTRAPNVLLLDESLLGQPRDALEARLGRACYEADEGLAWNALQNTVMSCGFPTGQVLAVRMRDGKSIGYYLGDL